MKTKSATILGLALVFAALSSASALAESPPHEAGKGAPKAGHPTPATTPINRLNLDDANACALVQGPSAPGTASQVASAGPTRPKLPESNDPQFIELYKGLNKCGPCHEVSITGNSLQNIKFAFTGGRGRMGEVNAHEIINALNNITEMNNVKLTPSERAAIVAWSKVK